MAVGFCLVAALIGIPTATFLTLGAVDSYSGAGSNAGTWNATLNTSSTFGVNIIPLFILIIASALLLGLVSLKKGL